MRILHLSHTPLVGAPGRVCRALNLHSGIDARWAVLDSQAGNYAAMPFDLDLVWNRDRDEILELAKRADVIHLHNYLGLDSKEFAPIDFRSIWNEGRAILRQFHSVPELVAKYCKVQVSDVLDCPLPKLVIAQYPERYYPNSRLVPNIVFPVSAPEVSSDFNGAIRIGYAPSRFNSGRSSRWDTKGYPETVKLLKRFSRKASAKGASIEIDIIEQVPHSECLARKAKCHIVLDDLVTGSYHLNTLESLAQGAACITYMDRRTLQAISELTGRSDFPALGVGLENAREVLLDLASSPELVLNIGKESKAWMREHWDPKSMATHFLQAYERVLDVPGQPFPVRWKADLAERWKSTRLHDLEWESRSQFWPVVAPKWLLDIRGLGGYTLRKLGIKN